jgi:hypothetical protein
MTFSSVSELTPIDGFLFFICQSITSICFYTQVFNTFLPWRNKVSPALETKGPQKKISRCRHCLRDFGPSMVNFHLVTNEAIVLVWFMRRVRVIYSLSHRETARARRVCSSVSYDLFYAVPRNNTCPPPSLKSARSTNRVYLGQLHTAQSNLLLYSPDREEDCSTFACVGIRQTDAPGNSIVRLITPDHESLYIPVHLICILPLTITRSLYPYRHG